MGSSSRRTSGDERMARASIARFFWPPESSARDLDEVRRLVEAEARERLVDLRDHVVAALVLEAVRQVVVPVVEGRGVLPFGHLVLEPPHLRLDGVEVREGAGDVVVERLGEVGAQSLLDRRDPEGVPPDHLSAVRLLATEGQPQEGRLPGAVSPDETDLLARVVLPGDVLQDLLRPVGLADVIEAVEHRAIVKGTDLFFEKGDRSIFFR